MSEKTPKGFVKNEGINSDTSSIKLTSTTDKAAIRVIRWPELQQKIGGRSLTAVTRAEKAGKFPKRVRQGNHVGWLEHEINEYLLGLPRGTRCELLRKAE